MLHRELGAHRGEHRAGVKPFTDHFSQLAASYAQFRPQYPGALYDWIAAQCAARERAWDCACGSGQATLALAELYGDRKSVV